MPKVIKGKSIVDDTWVLINELDDSTDPASILDQSILPVKYWLAHAPALAARSQHLGVWFNSDENPDDLELPASIHPLALIAINFPIFTDGRGYSYARRLREHYKYTGEIRAIGNVLVDQLFYMSRCGFDAFALQDDKKPEDGIKALSAFSENYQASLEQPKPLFKRI